MLRRLRLIARVYVQNGKRSVQTKELIAETFNVLTTREELFVEIFNVLTTREDLFVILRLIPRFLEPSNIDCGDQRTSILWPVACIHQT